MQTFLLLFPTSYEMSSQQPDPLSTTLSALFISILMVSCRGGDTFSIFLRAARSFWRLNNLFIVTWLIWRQNPDLHMSLLDPKTKPEQSQSLLCGAHGVEEVAGTNRVVVDKCTLATMRHATSLGST